MHTVKSKSWIQLSEGGVIALGWEEGLWTLPFKEVRLEELSQRPLSLDFIKQEPWWKIRSSLRSLLSLFSNSQRVWQEAGLLVIDW